MKGFFSAVSFFTVVPVPQAWVGGERELARCARYLPLLGLLIGAGAALLDVGLLRSLPPLPASTLAVFALIAISGAFHLDGLADTADGFLSARPRDRILEIMKDSRVGTMGVVAVALVLGLKVALLASLPATARTQALFLMPVAGRCAGLWMLTFLPHARSEGGLGMVVGNMRFPGVAAGAWLVLILATWCVSRGAAMGVAIGTVLCTSFFAIWCVRKIGGMTGDTCGAATELAEVIPALVLASACCAGCLA